VGQRSIKGEVVLFDSLTVVGFQGHQPEQAFLEDGVMPMLPGECEHQYLEAIIPPYESIARLPYLSATPCDRGRHISSRHYLSHLDR
jgi:hypothetical protein